MMTMKTQFGNMTITDDNKTIANEELQKEINDSMIENKKAEFIKPEIFETSKPLDK